MSERAAPAALLAGMSLALACSMALSASPDEGLADPTRPPAGLNAAPSEPVADALPRLSAIFVGKHGGHAVVDGVPLKVGDVWKGLEIVSVEGGRVRVKRNGTLVDLHLLGAPITKRTEGMHRR